MQIRNNNNSFESPEIEVPGPLTQNQAEAKVKINEATSNILTQLIGVWQKIGMKQMSIQNLTNVIKKQEEELSKLDETTQKFYHQIMQTIYPFLPSHPSHEDAKPKFIAMKGEATYTFFTQFYSKLNQALSIATHDQEIMTKTVNAIAVPVLANLADIFKAQGVLEEIISAA